MANLGCAGILAEITVSSGKLVFGDLDNYTNPGRMTGGYRLRYYDHSGAVPSGRERSFRIQFALSNIVLPNDPPKMAIFSLTRLANSSQRRPTQHNFRSSA